MSTPKIFYNPIEGSAPLSIYWHSEMRSDAVEAECGEGVGFFDLSQNMLGVVFDDVEKKSDEQELLFSNGGRVRIQVSSGKVTIAELVWPVKSA